MPESDNLRIPAKGLEKGLILEQMQRLREQDVPWHENRAFSLVYHQSDEHTEFLKQAHSLFFEGNGLNPMAFTSLRTFEHEVMRMTARLLNGGPNAVGTMTSGGTESILLAVRTYRDWARKRLPRIKRPEIIVPNSVHVAFEKAGKYFDVRMVHAPLAKDFRVDVNAVRRLISPNTIALVGSAPNYPNGMIDPIEELGDLAQKHGLGMHVDACVGGFLLPWVERLGYPLPAFDFRVPGVTSISADVHKYGYAAKGASTITYRDMEFFRHQYYVYVDWPGGVFASPSLPGTRPGGTIAAAWAALMAMGEDGYLRNAKNIMEITRRFVDGINAIDGIRVLGEPPATVFAYAPTDKRLNCYAIGDFMDKRGWHIDRQQKPACLHAMINPGHGEIIEEYLADLREAVAFVRTHPDAALSGSAPAYGLIANAPMRGLIEKNVRQMVEEMYGPAGKAPELDEEGGGVPKPLLAAMKLKARLGNLFRRGSA